MEATKHANAAQLKNKPDPTETTIPRGTGFAILPMRISLMASVFFIKTVHMLAPIRIRRLPAMAKIVDTKNVRLFFAIPLGTDVFEIRKTPRDGVNN